MSDSNTVNPSPLGARPFVDRHIGPDETAVAEMLKVLGFDSLETLMDAAVPGRITSRDALALPSAASEAQATSELRALAALNNPAEPMIGLGYHGTITPAVIRRNVLEDPSWYTAYTPYQPEISQGRLEALLNFQTMVADLTGLPTANASLLDEGTAAAEAMTLVRRAAGSSKAGSAGPFVVDADALPQTIAVVQTRAAAMGIEVLVADLADGLPDGELSGVLVQYPGASGRILDPRPVIESAHERGALAVVAADLLALTLLEAPGMWGADVVVGSSQRFGVPLFYGGPHAGFMSVRAGLERHLPGRLVGVSVDSAGRPAYRLSLQTREQHIRRDKATSNICTAQVLLAVVAAMYAVYHGPDGLRRIAQQVHGSAVGLARQLREAGVDVVHDAFFDTVLARVPGRAADVVTAAREGGVHLRLVDADHVGISVGETADGRALGAVLSAFGVSTGSIVGDGSASVIPAELRRDTDFLSHPVFNTHRSETSMLRYLRRLSARDYALDRGMIPLGSCTMKLNATSEMEPISLPGFADLHPFAPAEDTVGYQRLVADLEGWLAEVTGYDRVSIQPNAGSQGELAGLLAIRGYHQARGDQERNVCLIPSSAHGTNAASAVMAGMKVVVVKATDDGAVDLDDLRAQCETHSADLAAIMVTYPSTHGAYEDTISDLCEIVHERGGQVYVDGANLNALLGYARPGKFGGDVSHLNLHKTFCIPHGGGGPGVGPVGVREHLAPYLPSHPMHPEADKREGIGPISAAPYGSAGILPISWAYVRMMGGEGLTRATAVAVLAANYVAARLEEHFPVLYRGHNDLVAHECILDVRGLSKQTGVSIDDVAKRLIDYGFHAPTMSFPVAGTLMVEPTESEDLAELDRFCDAMVAIRGEIDKVASGEWRADDSPLRGAPHTADAINQELSYDLATAVFPTGFDPDKYWPPVGRIDQAYGDRNLVCSCPPPEAVRLSPRSAMKPERWQAALDRAQAAGRLPSIVGGVLTGGRLVWRGSAGQTADPEQQYRIGSITKTLTAVLVLQCRDDGLLGLDDPLGTYLPESGYRDATLRELLSHTSGMQAEPVGPWWERSPGTPVADLIGANDGSGRVLEAATSFHYSNLGFGLLGEIVARLRGDDWWSLVQERLLRPLGMTRTSYHPQAPHAQGSSVDHFAGTRHDEPHEDSGAMAPAGQLWSTIGDLGRWLDFLATGHPEVLTRETLVEMAQPVAPAEEYGLGLRLLRGPSGVMVGRVMVGHTGSMPGFLATAFVDQQTRNGVIALTNATTGVSTDRLALDLYAGADPTTAPSEPWVPSTEVPDEVAELLGLWFWGNTALELRWNDNLLESRTLAPPELSDRYAVMPDRIVGVEGYHLGETLHVHRGADGTVDHLECTTFVYTRHPTR